MSFVGHIGDDAAMETPRPDRERFAIKLKSLRALNGMMTQEELAQDSGVDVGLIQNYEQGKSLAKLDVIEKLAEALGASPAGFQAVELRDLLFSDDFDEVGVVAQLLFQIAGAYDLKPYFKDGVLGVTGNSGYIEYAMAKWCELLEIDHRNSHEAFEEGISDEEYAKRKAVMDASSEDVKRFELGYDGSFDAADYPVQPPRLGETLKRLRVAAGLTQSDLADAAGVSVFAVRAYEQGKRTPNSAQRKAIAGALGVPAETLTDFGITDPNEAFHFLIEMAHIYYLNPQRIGDEIVLCKYPMYKEGLSIRPSLDKLFGGWFFACVDLEETGDKVAYQDWQDHFEG